MPYFVSDESYTMNKIDVHYPPALLSYMWGNRKLFLNGVILALLRTAVIAPIPWLFQILIDEQVKTGNIPGIFMIAVLVLGLLSFHYAFAVQGAVIIGRQNGLLLMRLRGDIFDKLHFLNFGFLDRQKSGRLLSKYAFDTQKVEAITMQMMNQFMPNILYSLTIMVILLFLNWRLALVLVFLLPAFGLIRIIFHKHLGRVNRATRIAQERLTGAANEAISALRLVRSYGEEDQVTDHIDQYSYALALNRFKLSSINAMYSTFSYIVSQVFTLATIAGGAYFVATGEMTMGTLLAFMAALPVVLMPIQLFTNISEQYFVAQEGYVSVKELLDSKYVEEWKGTKRAEPFTGAIQFDDVTFAYPNTTRDVIIDYSLTIDPGMQVALVGGSGSGKSTIAQLILGLYKPAKGAILIDGVPLPDLDMRWLRRNAAVVLQDIVLFSGTIAENIRFARPDASEEDLHEAARMANAESFILQMPEGYETIVGERGAMLSGGQRQRLSIARAILRNPKILILDEATSALDYESERLVQEALARVSKGRTVITIAHRLSTIRQADHIVVMKEGRIMESGRYEELVAAGGAFSDLLNMQDSDEE